MSGFIHTVTITGVDIYTDLNRLEILQARFPCVEWGVLLSKTKAGFENRYPPANWVTDLIGTPLRMAGHICGQWARDITVGGDMFCREQGALGWLDLFRRVQLNISNILPPYRSFHDAIRKFTPRVIVQVKDLNQAVLTPIIDEVDFLFDCSGGLGILPEHWPTPRHADILLPNCGYAGGLNPENLVGQISLMQESANGQQIWIDVESGVRTNDVLDLDKVERFLEAAQPYVIQTSET